MSVPDISVPEINSSEIGNSGSNTIAEGFGFALWRRQLRSVVGIEVNKAMFSRGAIVAYTLAALPILLSIIIAIADDHGEPIAGNIDGARRVYGIIYSGFVLSAVVLSIETLRPRLLLAPMHLCAISFAWLTCPFWIAALSWPICCWVSER